MLKRLLIIIIIIFTGLVLYFLSRQPQPSSQILGEQIAPTAIPTPTPSLTTTPKPTPTPIPPRKTVQLGIVIDDYVSGSAVAELEKITGKKFATVSIFKQFGGGNSNLSQGDLSYIKNSGKKLLLAWEPWDPQAGNHQSRDYLQEINSGAQDGYLDQFATAVKNYGGQVIIRFGHEMNGNWYPWGNRPAEYISAYRRIHGMFVSRGAANVRWMWSINAENVPPSPITAVRQYYPGDAFVDIIGLDGFNFGTSQPGSVWRSFTAVFSPAYQYIAGYKKPIMISEIGCAETGGDKAQWIRDMAGVLREKMPGIDEIVWFNLNKETDWRIESSPRSQAAWKLAF